MSIEESNVAFWPSLIKSVIADIGVALVFAIGYHFFRKWNQDQKFEEPSPKSVKTTVSKWEEVSTLQKMNMLIIGNTDTTMDAYKILKQIERKNVTPDIVTYNCLLEMSFKLDQADIARKLFEEINESTYPVQPDTVTYNILFKELVSSIIQKEGTIDEVKKWILEMNKKKIAFNQITYNIWIDAAVEARDCDYAWEWFQEMKDSETIKPDIYTFTTLIKGLKNPSNNLKSYESPNKNNENVNRVMEMISTVKQIPEIKIDEVLYNAAIDSCITFNKIHLAEQWFTEMKGMGITPTQVTYSSLIKGYGQIHNINGALVIFNEMRNNHIRANDVIYGCLLNSLVKCNKIELIEQCYEWMEEDNIKPNNIIFTIMLKGYSKAKMFSKAEKIFANLQETQPNILNVIIYNAMLDCCVENNEIEKMQKIFEDFTERAKKNTTNNVSPNVITYSTMIKGLAKNGQNDEAMNIYGFVLKNFTDWDEVLFNSIADGFARVNQEEIVLKVLQEMKNRNIKRSSIIYSILLKMYSLMGKEDKCVWVFRSMLEDNVQPSVISYTTWMQMYIRKKNMESAIRVFKELNLKWGADFVSYNFIINSCTFNKKLETAIELWNESLNKNIKWSEETYNNVANYLIENKFMRYQERVRAAEGLLQKFKERKVSLRNEVYQRFVKLIYNNNKNTKDVEGEIRYSKRNFGDKKNQKGKFTEFNRSGRYIAELEK